MTNPRSRVLVVDDERDLADLYALWLESRFDVTAAYSGTDALGTITEETDVVLLDRRMPGMTGDEVLDEIRSRGLSARVAMLTAVEPDFDILEMGFDDYVIKPVSEDALIDLVERMLGLTEYEQQVQELYTLGEKRALLEAKKTAGELAASEEFAALDEQISTLKEEAKSSLLAFDDQAMGDLIRGPSEPESE